MMSKSVKQSAVAVILAERFDRGLDAWRLVPGCFIPGDELSYDGVSAEFGRGYFRWRDFDRLAREILDTLDIIDSATTGSGDIQYPIVDKPTQRNLNEF